MNGFVSYKKCRKELLSLLKVIKFLDTENPKKEIYSTLCEGSVIIIGTLFESFLENIVQEYIDEITVKFNNREISYSQLPSAITEYIAKNKIQINPDKNNQYSPKQVQRIVTDLIKELSNGFIINKELDGINKFSFGKHGETEVKNTFKRIGIDISEWKINFSRINNFFRTRNELVHREDITQPIPPETEDIKEYIILFYFYIKVINTGLRNELSSFHDR